MAELLNKRQAGVFLAISSLPSKYGVGDFGENARNFIDILAASEFKIWQILPLNTLGYGNSPYQAYTSEGIDPLYIDLDELYDMKLIANKPEKLPSRLRVNYDEARNLRYPLYEEAYNNFIKQADKKLQEEFENFKNKAWVKKYALFMSLKKKNNLKWWLDWPEDEKNYSKAISKSENFTTQAYDYECFLQFILEKQWLRLKKYANKKGISIMGDIPIYPGHDSDDVWSNTKYFMLDETFKSTWIAGCPPDYFNSLGQVWGNPLYNWDKIKEDKFIYWINKVAKQAFLYDIVRLDHFLGFDSYWIIEAGAKDARNGKRLIAPGMELFGAIYEAFPNINIVVEDLGEMRPQVHQIRDHFDMMGMRILQFTLEHKDYYNHYLLYTGNHDNQPTMAWYAERSEEEKEFINNIFRQNDLNEASFSLNFIALSLASMANMVIIPVVDILGLGQEAQMNHPGTSGSPNWEFCLPDLDELSRLSGKISELNTRFNRLGKKGGALRPKPTLI